MILLKKKEPGRFTLRFDMEDASQRKAAQILNAHKNKKAVYLTDLILRQDDKGISLCREDIEAIAQCTVKCLVAESLTSGITASAVSIKKEQVSDAGLDLLRSAMEGLSG